MCVTSKSSVILKIRITKYEIRNYYISITKSVLLKTYFKTSIDYRLGIDKPPAL